GAWKNLEAGKHEIDGTKVYALVSAYAAKSEDQARYETHKDYLDIQMLSSGAEIIEVRDARGLEVSVPYKPDIEFYATPHPNPCFSMRMEPGLALVLFPEDAHRPCLSAPGYSGEIKKVVVKVAL
ncbi:MAG TPA: YhcH/YjgK/YiaL family protein, partial [Rectinemataceae bacterium]